MSKPRHVAFLTIMPSPYTCDLFAALAENGRIRLSVFYMEMSAPDTHWGDFPLPDYAQVLPGRWVNLLGGRVHLNLDATERVFGCSPDVVVIAGYSSVTSQRLMRHCTTAGIPWVFWGELPGIRQGGGVRRMLRRLAMRPAIRGAWGVAAIGSRAQKAYGSLFGNRCPVDNIPYCCEMGAFNAESVGRTPGQRRLIRFLFCGQLIHRKGIDLLIEAFMALAAAFPQVHLDLVGTGDLEQAIRSSIPAPIKDRVLFHGFQPVARLPALFAAADVFVLPSRHDGWGVVVNQAIAAGLPVICSDAVGAADDLVEQEGNGLIVPAGEASALMSAMKRLAASPATIAQFGARSRVISESWSPARVVDRWHELLAKVVGARPPSSSAPAMVGDFARGGQVPQHDIKR